MSLIMFSYLSSILRIAIFLNLARKPTLAQVAEEAKTQQAQLSGPSLKEKAFIVREVVVAKNVFGRRGSKLNKARSSSVTLAAAKSATDKLKKVYLKF